MISPQSQKATHAFVLKSQSGHACRNITIQGAAGTWPTLDMNFVYDIVEVCSTCIFHFKGNWTIANDRRGTNPTCDFVVGRVSTPSSRQDAGCSCCSKCTPPACAHSCALNAVLAGTCNNLTLLMTLLTLRHGPDSARGTLSPTACVKYLDCPFPYVVPMQPGSRVWCDNVYRLRIACTSGEESAETIRHLPRSKYWPNQGAEQNVSVIDVMYKVGVPGSSRR
jgi:hypothetical protein